MKFFNSATVLAFFVISTAYITSTAYAVSTPPDLASNAYVLMDYDTGEILAQKNADTPLPPASLTKMMTSYLLEQALMNGTLQEDTPIMMSENAWCRGSSSQSCMYVPVNTSASAIDMLRGIIIQSGNDASIAVAEHLAGSENAFANKMNEEAKRLGMTNTQFKNATGMPAEGHYASAKDLAVLAQAIIKDNTHYYPIYSEKEFTYNNITQGNRNTLLTSDGTVDGLKTGHTAEAGYCLVASSERDNMRLIAVIMGANSMQARADEARKLLAYGFENFDNVLLAPKGQSGTYTKVRFGKNDTVELITADALKVLTTQEQKDKLTTVIQTNGNITAPIQRGQALGKMVAMLDGKAVASVSLVAADEVAEVNFLSRLWQGFTEWLGNLF